jgi:hypothetical protein
VEFRAGLAAAAAAAAGDRSLTSYLPDQVSNVGTDLIVVAYDANEKALRTVVVLVRASTVLIETSTADVDRAARWQCAG